MKRICALMLTTALLWGMTGVAFAQNNRINGFVDNYTLADGYWASGAGRVSTDRPEQTVVYQKTIQPGQRDYINLTSDMFEWDDQAQPSMTEKILRENGLSPHVIYKSGKDAIENLSIDFHERQIVIQYTKHLVATEPVPFEFNVHLVINGKRHSDRGITFSGVLENSVVSVSKGPSIDISKGVVAQAKADIPKIRVKLGGATVTTNLRKGEKYYGVCVADPSAADRKLMKEHSQITKVLTLHTIGLDGEGSAVHLDKKYEKSYIYDKDLVYLGRGDKQLPYCGKYYISKRKLDG